MRVFGAVTTLLGSVIIAATPLVPSMSFWPRNIPWWLGFVVGLIVLIMGGIMISSGESQGFQPDKQLTKTEDAYPCPVCGQRDFTWGVMPSPALARFRTRKKLFFGYGTPVLTRLCNHCGNLILFAREKRP